jgi:hypothetical protein
MNLTRFELAPSKASSALLNDYDNDSMTMMLHELNLCVLIFLLTKSLRTLYKHREMKGNSLARVQRNHLASVFNLFSSIQA